MELELKHLAPYLPYGLKFEINVFDQATVSGLMVGLNDKEIEFSGISETVTESFSYDLCIPILRPLSDLVNYYNKICYGLMDARNPNNYKSSKFDIDLVIRNGVMFDTDNGFVNWLYENHFDVFGLIKAGLAIDINTLSANGS
jgi:hypothetical protein